MRRFIIITILFYAVFSIFVTYNFSRAFFTNMAVASNNSFTAATTFPNLTPTSGQELPTATPSTTPTPADVSTNVLLNEIQFKPTETNGEWVEVFNAGSTSVDLTGWSIIDGANNAKSLTSLGTLPAHSFKSLDLGTAILNNTTVETLTLRNASMQQVDSHTFIGTSIKTDQTIGKNPDGIGAWKACITASKSTTNIGAC